MHIHHLAIWTENLETLRSFYETYFHARSGPKYTNPAKGFESCFLSFETGASLELMSMPGIPTSRNDPLAQFTGLIHFAISTGSAEAVDDLTARIQAGGHTQVSPPRWTGDGYYESVVFDPDGNRIEITI